MDDDRSGDAVAAKDRRPTAGDPEPTGPRRALIAVYATFALAATARAGVQIGTKFHEAPLAYILSLVSGIIYIGATIGLSTRRPFSRALTWVSCSIELIGVLTVGIFTLSDSSAFPDDTVWSDFGSGYVYIPIVLPLLGLGWMWRSRHLRHAAAAPPAAAPPEIGAASRNDDDPPTV